ncbi:hypothetical protein HYPBUDRAFT_141206 [Hyphopichia burtonii NRRL Y-1933]|uniref:Coenzyme Q-binding protein COQ10 START domain-containing protein n=1 Tax=Hyphopichia burtonii NRRL Y-1933 TaxID=984485 RepID=A0A1E4RH62_9ASCO|nr:hypothetical protein HYPBUDRAFT_141206 [Hyphopichia burtonii NRRL Y-1933]ODV66607.1 hypothetical protein HYPBUDRAFT_141206 [Hyphopichia burtonii NRRL Y-1933]
MVYRFRLLSPLRQMSGVSHGISRVFQRSFFNIPSPFENQNKLIEHKVKSKINATPEQMFEIVSDVSRYNEFVPFVEESFINKRDANTNLPSEAGLRVGWKQFDERFVCKLTCDDKIPKVIAESITVSLFDNLYTEWIFRKIPTLNVNQESNCEIELILKYKFKNPLYNTISSIFQEQVTQIMLKAFTNRATQLKLQKKFKDRQVNFNKIK